MPGEQLGTEMWDAAGSSACDEGAPTPTGNVKFKLFNQVVDNRSRGP